MATVIVVQRRMKALQVRTHSKRQPQMPYTSYGHVVECNGCWPLSCAAAAPLLLCLQDIRARRFPTGRSICGCGPAVEPSREQLAAMAGSYPGATVVWKPARTVRG
jgi:hypothetical protein